MGRLDDVSLKGVHDYFWETAGRFDILSRMVLNAPRTSTNGRIQSVRSLYPFASDSVYHSFRLAYPSPLGVCFWLKDSLPFAGSRRRKSRHAVYSALGINQDSELEWGLPGLNAQVSDALRLDVEGIVADFGRALEDKRVGRSVDSLVLADFRVVERPLITALSWFAAYPGISHDVESARALQNDSYFLSRMYEFQNKRT